jgi:hypothetical protein
MVKCDEKLIVQHMQKLGISREEAIQLIEDDQAIDRGAKMFELDPELEKGAKKARQAERKASTAPVKRERKAKPEKAEICSAMMDGLKSLGVDEFTISNPEREFVFIHNGTKYKVTLACPRS